MFVMWVLARNFKLSRRTVAVFHGYSRPTTIVASLCHEFRMCMSFICEPGLQDATSTSNCPICRPYGGGLHRLKCNLLANNGVAAVRRGLAIRVTSTSYSGPMKTSQLTLKQKLSVRCPVCGAAIGVRCKLYSGLGHRNEPHVQRKDAAFKATKKLGIARPH
jgi:hypothetical protein